MVDVKPPPPEYIVEEVADCQGPHISPTLCVGRAAHGLLWPPAPTVESAADSLSLCSTPVLEHAILYTQRMSDKSCCYHSHSAVHKRCEIHRGPTSYNRRRSTQARSTLKMGSPATRQGRHRPDSRGKDIEKREEANLCRCSECEDAHLGQYTSWGRVCICCHVGCKVI